MALQASFDVEDYNEADLLTLTIPLSMPYQLERPQFERVDGEVTFEGKIYKYVKRKVVEGKLVLLCLPDNNKMRIQSAKDDFFKFSNDLVQNNTSKKVPQSKTGVFKNLSGDYISDANYSSLKKLKVPRTFSFTTNDLFFPYTPHISPWQPPEC